ncbi:MULTISPECIES: roadblock/LC7 domain-containing protein [Methanocalculus]|uniref:roadblock/LC7 domain-containing protein n=1 Tax=Methanocalculus TaxID=71151 RepID=UPI00209F5C5B|nr:MULTISPECIES: roadblock/LC7 domain-containing protein [unclassified Methanocalculus]MCP1662385.1 putative regulator of Ras-like GTPase activity (Roadblock/LC7/MglB family) [Methanocalculus sp. AMF5]
MTASGSLKEKVRQFIDEIRAVPGVGECALVSNDGILIGKTFEDSLAAQSFGAMCATLYASSEAASSVVNIESPAYVMVRGSRQSILVVGAGPRLLIAGIVDEEADMTDISSRLQEIGERIGGAL